VSCGLISPHLPFLAVWVRRTEGSYSMRAFGFLNGRLWQELVVHLRHQIVTSQSNYKDGSMNL
jgi:hypothetical protein